MTLSEFRAMTRLLSGDLDLHILDEWGVLWGVEMVTPDELHPDDPARATLQAAGAVVVLGTI